MCVSGVLCMSVNALEVQSNNQLHHNHKAIHSNLDKNIILKSDKQIKDVQDKNASAAVIDSYPVGDIKLGDDLKENINKTLVHGLMATDIGVGTYQLHHPDASLEKIATNLKTSSQKLKKKMGDMSDLQKAYYDGNQSNGIASIAMGTHSLVNFTTGIYDIYNDIAHNKKQKTFQKDKEMVVCDFIHAISQQELSDENLNILKQETLNKINHYQEQEKEEDVKFKHKKQIINDINQGTNILSSASNLIVAHNMFRTVANPKTISQAVSAFGFGAGASAQTVAAVKIGMGLLATGMTVSSVAALLNIAHYFMERMNNTPEKKHDEEKNNQPNRDLLNGTTQLMNGIGNLVLLKSNHGYDVKELLNNNKMFLGNHTHSHFIKLLTYIGTYSTLFDGVKSLLNAYAHSSQK